MHDRHMSCIILMSRDMGEMHCSCTSVGACAGSNRTHEPPTLLYRTRNFVVHLIASGLARVADGDMHSSLQPWCVQTDRPADGGQKLLRARASSDTCMTDTCLPSIPKCGIPCGFIAFGASLGSVHPCKAASCCRELLTTMGRCFPH